ncbi:MAG: heavy metal translocating P-type ATPase metal-binding domain-containing protein [Bacteroidota bacterium]
MIEKAELVGTQCFHCGEDCQEEIITKDDKHFCCLGCQTVYDILYSNGLSNYYSVESNPGVSPDLAQVSANWAFLDQPEVIQSLINFQEGGTSRITFFVPAIHCSACIWLLEHLPELHKGVLQSSVHFLKKEVSITYAQEQLSLRQLAELLESIGYAPSISLASGSETKNKKKSSGNSLAIKVGVAGFCFGNIMLLSLPDYLDSDSLDATYRTLFNYLMLGLSLPVLLYSASSYFSSAFKGLRHNLLTIDVPIALGILVLFSRSAYEIISQTGTGYLDSLAGLVFFLLIGQWFQNKTYQALSYDRDYASYFPIAVTKLIQQEEHSTLLKDLEIGDQLLIRNQELIPADAILIRGDAQIDYSFVTGESEPISKTSGDLLYAGGRQQGGPLVIELCKPVTNSYLTELWNQDVFTKSADSSIRPLIDRVSKYFTWFIISLSLLTAGYWLIADPSLIPNTVTSVLIVACPCALALSVPFTLGHAMRILGKQGLYVKNTKTIEKLATIDEVVFDKTGTITQQNSSTSKKKKLLFIGQPLSRQQKAIIRSTVRNSTHPLSQAIYYSLPNSDNALVPTHFEEKAGYGLEATIEDTTVRVGSEKWVNEGATSYLFNRESSEEKSFLATRVYVKLNDEVHGYFRFDHFYRPGITTLLQNLRKRFVTHLLSGDQDQERNTLSPYFQYLHFRQSPIDKLHYVQKLEAQGHRTLMLGDGLNDAGALKQSHAGIAIADNVYHFSPACDAILDAKRLTKLDVILNFSGNAMRIVRYAIGLSFLYNLVGLSFAVSGLLTPLIAAILMPLSSITVVGFITVAMHYKGRKLNHNND